MGCVGIGSDWLGWDGMGSSGNRIPLSVRCDFMPRLKAPHRRSRRGGNASVAARKTTFGVVWALYGMGWGVVGGVEVGRGRDKMSKQQKVNESSMG